MCEDLRCYLMRKMAIRKKKLESYSGQLAPVQQKKLEEFVKPKANKWRAIWAGDNDRVLFEVHRGASKVGVNLQQRTCTCNVWQLTGMPCCHAVAAMYKIGLKPEEHVHKWLTMQSIRATYMHCIKPVNSEEYWTPCDAPRMEPPNIKRPAHRPKMKRKVDPVEPEMHATKAKKTFEVTCSKCGQLGHYYKTCKNDPKDPNWQPLTKKERRAGKGKGLQIVPFDTNQNRVQDVGTNVNLNNPSVQPPPPMDPQTKAKKYKKKLPKTMHNKGTSGQQEQGEEIPLSQNAPQADEVAGEAMNLNQPPPQSCSTPNLSYAQRRKHPVVRPPTAPISAPPSFGQPTPPSVQAASGLRPCVPTGQAVNPRTTTANVLFQQSAPSAETMAAASSGTAARLFKFIPTPGFIPPRKT
ncbi:hypothetical protein AHAS_Ahas04G0212200 [Arachis hypogaea]